jgi:hypothetical protein
MDELERQVRATLDHRRSSWSFFRPRLVLCVFHSQSASLRKARRSQAGRNALGHPMDQTQPVPAASGGVFDSCAGDDTSALCKCRVRLIRLCCRLFSSEPWTLTMGGAPSRSSRVRVFRSSILSFPMADSDPSYLRARRVPHGRKTRTLRKNREECGTRKSNPPRHSKAPSWTQSRRWRKHWRGWTGARH